MRVEGEGEGRGPRLFFRFLNILNLSDYANSQLK